MNRSVIVLSTIVLVVVLVLAGAIGFIVGSQAGAHASDTARGNPYVRDEEGVAPPNRPIHGGGATTGSGTTGSATGSQGGGT